MDSPKVPVCITYHQPGTEPPIFVGGTFSQPPWSLQEMEYTLDENGNKIFKKEILVEPGAKVQYKFRIGLGDRWVVDETTPTVTDEQSNRNNIIEAPHSAEGMASKAATASRVENTDPPKSSAEGKGGQDDDNKEGQKGPPLVANAARAILARSNPRSGAGTPNIAGTADEVADSAMLLDKEESDPEISDGEAGRLGVRRLSSTPIPQVAATAAEVADVAEQLDAEPNIQLAPHPYGYDSMNRLDPFDADGESGNVDNDDGDSKAPLFSHECIGMYDPGDDEEDPLGNNSHQHDTARRLPKRINTEELDFNDPTLEVFPFDRHEIMDTVRKIETGLGEDGDAFHGMPLSPVVSPFRRGSGDPMADLYSMESSSSPNQARTLTAKAPGPSRSPHPIASSDRMSASSLQSIVEDEEPAAGARDEQVHTIRVPVTTTQNTGSAPKSPVSDEDEGIVMNNQPGIKITDDGESKVDGLGEAIAGIAISSKSAMPAASLHTDSGVPDPLPAIDEQDGAAQYVANPPETGTENATPTPAPTAENPTEHPHTVVQPADQNESVTAIGARSIPESTNADAAQSTGMEEGTNRQSRGGQGLLQRSGSPGSLRSTGMQAHTNGNWLMDFFRILFVDWIGGLFNKLWGRRREA